MIVVVVDVVDVVVSVVVIVLLFVPQLGLPRGVLTSSVSGE